MNRRVLPSDIFPDIKHHMLIIQNSYSVKSGVKLRIKAVLLYHEVRNYKAVSLQLGTAHSFVQTWNKRACKELAVWDVTASEKLKRDTLLKVFSDLPRASGPSRAM